ncbi:response regulator [Thermoflexus sp.]|uniref:response regulator n=1 Tax=Thermoflexus sp. TaxID=1969742 RepID=UPI001775E2A5
MEMSGKRILIVDDERAIRRFLRLILEAHGYAVLEAVDGQEALQLTATQRPDLLLLDLGLPDIDGVEVLRRLREWTGVPVIVLSVREREEDKIAALDAGADDYLTKPFGAGELLARIRAALRRSISPPSDPVFEIGDLRVDLARRLVTRQGQRIELTPTEFALLRVLIQHAGKVLTHRQLLRAVWGPGYENDVHLLRVTISNLRRKLEPDPSRPRYIQTELGVGYRIKDADLP